MESIPGHRSIPWTGWVGRQMRERRKRQRGRLVIASFLRSRRNAGGAVSPQMIRYTDPL